MHCHAIWEFRKDRREHLKRQGAIVEAWNREYEAEQKASSESKVGLMVGKRCRGRKWLGTENSSKRRQATMNSRKCDV
jgi:hypothetical protein